MRARWLAVVLAVAGAAMSAPAAAEPRLEWRTLWRGALDGDSFCVRASWVSERDSLVTGHPHEPTYVGYQIEDASGRVWASDTIPDVRSGGRCDDVRCEAAFWRGGLGIKVAAACDPCYPSTCTVNQYVHVVNRDSTARSEWTDVEWSPAAGDAAEAWVEESCYGYAVPLQAGVSEGVVRFFRVVPPAGADGRAFRASAGSGGCHVPGVEAFGPRRATIPVYASAETSEAESLRVILEELPEARSAWIRMLPAADGGYTTEVVRLEIRIGERWVYVRPETLDSLFEP